MYRCKLIQFAHGELLCFSEEVITKDEVFLYVTQHDEHDHILYIACFITCTT